MSYCYRAGNHVARPRMFFRRLARSPRIPVLTFAAFICGIRFILKPLIVVALRIDLPLSRAPARRTDGRTDGKDEVSPCVH